MPEQDVSAAVAKLDAQSTVAELNQTMPSLFDDDTLAGMQSFTDAMQAFGDMPPESVSDYGTGFSVCEDKRQLIGTPFVIVEWRFSAGDYGVFTSAAIVTEDGRKLILNDGSTGIRAQLQQVTEKRVRTGHAYPRAGLVCKDGLRISEYTYQDEKGKETPASTFYLAN